mgnify:FL=1|tara:strand:+ start:1874 stop:2416 length:543 start_codon:yes stop_codon:yes gene_type:complete
MNQNEFEDKISDYIDNQLSASERKIFEKYLKENDEALEQIKSIKNTINLINSQKSIQTSQNFMPNLLHRIKTYKKTPINSMRAQNKKMIFGLSPLNSALMGAFVFSFVFLLVSIVPSGNSFFQSNIVSNNKNSVEKNDLQSPAFVNEEKELVSADSSEKAIKSKEKIKLGNKIELVKNKR